MEYRTMLGWLNGVSVRTKIDTISAHVEYVIVFDENPQRYFLYRSVNMGDWQELGKYKWRRSAMHDMGIAISKDMDSL